MELTITDKKTIACLRSANVPYKIRTEIILQDKGRRIKVFYDFIFHKAEKEFDVVDREIRDEIDKRMIKENK